MTERDSKARKDDDRDTGQPASEEQADALRKLDEGEERAVERGLTNLPPD
ncbi:hypothetical protein [Stakelama marina]|uniref:Uncharacterized protein n=1 Tax=Stakelama marina TaxID=2826939 RepID=A0A8T4IFP8_9SPHN|nr:hypothetical protein [Stakelama marina]MBR0551079.1 hypothetical protein [Stakelama marina]